MGDGTGIEWTDATWNPLVGCSPHSPGCKHCFAMGEAARQVRLAEGAGRTTHYAGLTAPSKAGPVWTGKLALAPEHILTAPLRWQRPRRVFVNSMGDLFHEDAPDAWIDQVFAVMAHAPQHTFQVLTKRAERMRAYFERPHLLQHIALRMGQISARGTIAGMVRGGEIVGGFEDGRTWPLPNVWLGISAEDQCRANERVPELLRTPAALRFVSAEPLLGPVDFAPWLGQSGIGPGGRRYWNAASLDWVIVGGESGSGARPMALDWAEDIVRDCQSQLVPVFVKQLGARPARIGEGGLILLGRSVDRKGGETEYWPERLRVREIPRAAGALL